MKQRLIGFTLGCCVLLVGALPASGQLWFFPTYAVPSTSDGPSTFLAGTYGRGLNHISGELDAFGAVVGHSGSIASFMGGLGLVTGGADDELTLGGAVGVDVAETESLTLGLNGGVGWMGPGDSNIWRFPIGLAVKGFAQSPEATIQPWVMPRVDIRRVSTTLGSDTDTDFGASAGVGFTLPSGFGVHTALDVLFGDLDEVWLFGIGGHYVIPGG